MKIAIVREAGGYGDIICMGGCSRALKEDYPNSHITAFVPEDFVTCCSHIHGIDEVVSLGTVTSLVKLRRMRDSMIDPDKYEYLSPVRGYTKIVDLFCPGFLNETSEPGRLKYTRSQLFAMAAGVKSIKNAFPIWNVRDEEKEWAEKYIRDINAGFPTICVNLKGSCSTRTYPAKEAIQLIQMMVDDKMTVIYARPNRSHFTLPKGAFPFVGSFEQWAAVVSMCDLALTVDTSLLHLAAALETPTVGIFTSTDCKPFIGKYPLVAVVEGSSAVDKCKDPCNYSGRKGWDSRKCRPNGCVRKEGIGPEAVFKEVQKFFPV